MMGEIKPDPRFYGCIPNNQTPEVMDKINRLAAPWDGQDITKTPPVIEWSSFENAIRDMPEIDSKWWEKYNWKDYVIESQSYRPNCAGCSEATAYVTRLLIQAGSQYSEQKPVKINPMMTWLISKGGSTWGGQSIGAMAQEGNETGNFLVEDIGDYDPSNVSTKRSDLANENAKKHQISYSIYDGNSPAEAILLACQKGFTCFVGNNRAISDGTENDSNGVACVGLSGGSWSHATAFAGYQNVNGENYVFWINSHGSIYESNDGTPPIGGWMPESTLKRFMGGSFADVCAIVYSEAEYDNNIAITLNPTERTA